MTKPFRTQAEVDAYMMVYYGKMGHNYAKEDILEDDPCQGPDEPESALQNRIVAWAREKGYPCLSFRKSLKARGFITPGWADVTLLLPEGRVVFLELKTLKGQLRKEQTEMMKVALWLGHEWYGPVRTWKQFISITERKSE